MLRTLALIALLLLQPASGARDAPRANWEWPAEPPRVVIRQFIAPATPYASGHRGIDIAVSSVAAASGVAGSGGVADSGVVLAPAEGVVHFAGVVVNRPVLSIRHPGGLISSFEPVETTLRVGDAVARGEPVGTVIAGHCSRPCLHFGVRLDGEYVSPLLYLGGIEASVLLPTRR